MKCDFSQKGHLQLENNKKKLNYFLDRWLTTFVNITTTATNHTK